MIIGIDTSCYTTSIAVTRNEELIYQRRLLLKVKPGTCGLRQSEAVFQHVRNLPLLWDEFPGGFMSTRELSAIAAADRPRPVAGSYLPVFQVGASFAELHAKMLGVPFIRTSHQEGHLRAVLMDQREWLNSGAAFLAWHISGGTTELLKVSPLASGFVVEKIGGTSDLQVGQFIDRIGVLLGTAFPAGPHLERLAGEAQQHKGLPAVTKGLTISFSGPASAAERLARQGEKPAEVAWQVFQCIAQSLLKATIEAVRESGIRRVLLVGGVASNQIIRESLLTNGIPPAIQFRFGPPELSSDNAVGVSLIGADSIKKG